MQISVAEHLLVLENRRDRLKLQQQQLEHEGLESRKGRIKERNGKTYLYLYRYDSERGKTVEEYVSVHNRAAVEANQRRYLRWMQVSADLQRVEDAIAKVSQCLEELVIA
ncbi:MAG: hypothetical protein AAF974_01870 [Cyanobacteria bacterium P01_E01_bin.34]